MCPKSPQHKAPHRLLSAQKAFAAHLRNPSLHPPPEGIEDRRMAIYRRLFFRNIGQFLANNFPVLRQLYTPDEWEELVRGFYHRHRAATPLFPEIPREFLSYLQKGFTPRACDPPFMEELAHYEWVELALELDEHDLAAIDADPEGDLLDHPVVVSPLAWSLQYRYPVHRISPDYRPQEAPESPTFLMVYRDRRDAVHFMELNAVSSALLQLLNESGAPCAREALRILAASLDHPDPEQVTTFGHELMSDWRSRDIILGTRPIEKQQESP